MRPGAGLLFFIAVALPTSAAHAATQSELCGNQNTEPQERIDACGAEIGSGRLAGKSLAEAYDNRGSAWEAKERLERSKIPLPPPEQRLVPITGPVSKPNEDNALRDFRRAAKISPGWANPLEHEANALWKEHDFKAAAVVYGQVIAIMPTFAPAYINRGNCYSMMGDTDRAIEDYTKALELKPNNPAVYRARAGAWLMKGDRARVDADRKTAANLEANKSVTQAEQP